MRKLAADYDLPLVDHARIIPGDARYFVDSVHFSPEGMQFLARNVSAPIIEILEESVARCGPRWASRAAGRSVRESAVASEQGGGLGGISGASVSFRTPKEEA